MRIAIPASTFANIDKTPLDFLRSQGFEVVLNTTAKRLDEQQLIHFLKGIDGAVAGLEPYTATVLNQLPVLKCISRCGVGLDTIDMAFAKQRGIAVFNTPEVVIEPVAEMTLAMILDLSRRISYQSVLMHQGQWQRLNGASLSGQTIGIIGLGRIGKRVCTLLKAIGAHQVIGYDINPDVNWAKEHEVDLVDVVYLLQHSDIISLHVNVEHQQTFKLDAKQLALMKQGASLVNTARGALVDEESLYNALVSGHLAGAALDVFEKEPYQGKLSELPQVILTPHVATLTAQSRLAMEMSAAEQLVKFLRKG